MAYANPADAAAYGAKHYTENRELYKERARAFTRRQRKLLLRIIREAKDVPCADCDTRFPAVCMDFDHLDPTAKDDEVANLIRRCVSVERLRTEIAKCEVVCSNCHRLRTHSRVTATVEPVR